MLCTNFNVADIFPLTYKLESFDPKSLPYDGKLMLNMDQGAHFYEKLPETENILQKNVMHDARSPWPFMFFLKRSHTSTTK